MLHNTQLYRHKQTWVRGPIAHLYNKNYTDNKTISDKDMRGNRVKYTTGNEWDWNQVCGKTRQNQWKMKNGSMMARRPVTSTPSTARTRRGNDFGEVVTVCSGECLSDVLPWSALWYIVSKGFITLLAAFMFIISPSSLTGMNEDWMICFLLFNEMQALFLQEKPNLTLNFLTNSSTSFLKHTFSSIQMTR